MKRWDRIQAEIRAEQDAESIAGEAVHQEMLARAEAIVSSIKREMPTSDLSVTASAGRSVSGEASFCVKFRYAYDDVCKATVLRSGAVAIFYSVSGCIRTGLRHQSYVPGYRQGGRLDSFPSLTDMELEEVLVRFAARFLLHV